MTAGAAKNEIVVVTPTNDAVVTGTIDPDSSVQVWSVPGLWICLNGDVVVPDPESEGDFLYRIPQWPTPTPDAPDAEDVYWWPISLYPRQVVECGDEGQIDVFENSAEKLH
jgi:hypothetical protein